MLFFSLSFIRNISAYLLFQANSFSHCKVLFSPVSFVFKVFLLGHLAPLQRADSKMQFSELLSTDAKVCYWEHKGTSMAAAGMLPVQQGKYRLPGQDISTLPCCLGGRRNNVEGRRHRERSREHSSTLETSFFLPATVWPQAECSHVLSWLHGILWLPLIPQLLRWRGK